MFSALSSYIWGENTENHEPADVMACDGEADWIFVERKNKNNAKIMKRENRIPNERGCNVDFDLDKIELIGLAAMEESWYVTPPSCFNVKKRDGNDLNASQFENLLIEHPSMSVYASATSDAEDFPIDDVTNDDNSVTIKRCHGNNFEASTAAKLQMLNNRKPLNELKESTNTSSDKINRKLSKRANLVHNRTNNQRKRKVRNRAEGRRVVQMGKRGN